MPEPWTQIPIEDCLVAYGNGRKIRQGWSPQCENHPAETLDDWGVLKTSAIQDGEYVESANKHIPSKLKPRTQLEVEADDILITCAGPRARCGVTCLVRKTRPKLLISGKMYQLRVDPEIIDRHLLELFLRESGTKKKIDEMKTGISDSGLNLTHSRFATLEVPLPPLAEQKRIVSKIEELFSELDAGEESLRRARRQLGVYRQALLKQAFEGKLTEQWRKQNPHLLQDPKTLTALIVAKSKRANFRTVQQHEIESWSNRCLDELTEFVTSGSRGWADYYSESGSLFIRAQNLNRDYLNLDDIAFVQPPESAEGRRTMVKFGDLLITITGANTTKAGWVHLPLEDAYVSQHVALCRPVSDKLSPFLYRYIISESGGRKRLTTDAYGAGKPGLNLDHVRSLVIPIPSLPEQQEIVRLLDEQFTVIEQNEREIDAALKRSAALRQSILKKAFTGHLVPQDPADEPASKLLQRIRAEREATAKAPQKNAAKNNKS
jgi:type I restriction enzyme S subunit